MASVKLNVGMASAYFITEAKHTVAFLPRPYIVLSNSKVDIALLAEILMDIYNLSLPKGFLNKLFKKAEKHPIEKFLDDLVHERRFSRPLFGTNRYPVLIFSKGIGKDCLFAMKILKLRGLSYLAAVNAREDYGKTAAAIESFEEVRKREVFRNENITLFHCENLFTAAGKHRTVITTDSNLKALLRQNPDIACPVQHIPITDMRQLKEEGVFD